MSVLEYDAIEGGYTMLSWPATFGACAGIVIEWLCIVAGQTSPFEAELGVSHFIDAPHVRTSTSEEERFRARYIFYFKYSATCVPCSIIQA